MYDHVILLINEMTVINKINSFPPKKRNNT